MVAETHARREAEMKEMGRVNEKETEEGGIEEADNGDRPLLPH
jgi:hypothetical protein